MQRHFCFSMVTMYLAATLACAAQNAHTPTQPQKRPTGKLAGTVYCADTDMPAREATTYLFQISDDGFGSRSGPQTDLDGRFAIDDLEEGDYFVIAILPGYMNLLGSLSKSHLDAMTPDDRKKFLGTLARATVTSSSPAQVSVRLERARGIEGTVTYDDGSPAIGLRVGYRLKTPESSTGNLRPRFMDDQVFGQYGPPTTDDLGHFKIFGLPPGEYAIRVTVPTQSSNEPATSGPAGVMLGPFGQNELQVYVGGALRESKAELIKVDASGPNKTADITIPLSKLHTVLGQVLLKSSGQPPVTANIQLLYADNQEVVRSVLAPNGRFAIYYVPEDNYILRAAAGSEPPPEVEETVGGFARPRHAIWHFPQADIGSPETSLHVTGNVEDISIFVPDPVIKKNSPSMEINREGYGFSTSVH